MKLETNLEHVETASQLDEIKSKNKNVMVCCGRMGPMCIPVYKIMEQLKDTHKNVKFADFAFDSPEADVIRKLPECRGFMGLPFTVYFKDGKAVKATSSIQNREQITEIIGKYFKA